MSNPDQARHAAAAALVEQVNHHLANESRHLDDMLDCSRELQRQLRRQPGQSADDLARLFREIEQRQLAINEARGAVLAVLASLPGAPTNLSGFLALVPEEPAAAVRQLRSEIFEKLDRVRSITLGNQMVLYYSYDFYQRLLRGLSGNEPHTSGYGPAGRRESLETGKVMLRNC
jgi:flagellar biosynthesis/type III secretory pathway chaperone